MYSVPLQLSAISIAESLFSASPRIKLNGTQAEVFQHEFTRIEQERSSSTRLSQMMLNSRENMFLFDVLAGDRFPMLQGNYPELMAEALRRSPKNLESAASEWRAFSNEFFINKGLPVPNSPQYVEIQEALGIYGKTGLERSIRKLKRTALWLLNRVSYNFWSCFRKPIKHGG